MKSEVDGKADFSIVRYAQCWEDADILLAALDVQPHHTCLSIASAGDNVLALLSKGPARVVALDLSPAQLACLEVRVAAYRVLAHDQLLELLGARPSHCRADLYARCRPLLQASVQRFWDAQPNAIEHGFGAVGKFERYLGLFGRWILPLVQSSTTLAQLEQPRSLGERRDFYARRWDNWRWRAIFRLFFSQAMMARLGRDPSFFAYAAGDTAGHLLARTRHALVDLDPALNPYLQWILRGEYSDALPYALRPENFQRIRANLDRLEWHCASVEEYLGACNPHAFDCFNLSDIFEYMSDENYAGLLETLCDAARPGARLAYWNLFAARRRPMHLADRLQPLDALSAALFAQDKAFFDSDFVVEVVR